MLTAKQRLQSELPSASTKTIETLAASAFHSRDDIEDVVRSNEDGRKLITNLLEMSDDKFKQMMGWKDWPEHCGVTLSGPCPMGVLAPSESEMEGETGFAAAEHAISLPDHFSTSRHFQPPRSQGSIGSCHSFASIGTLEGQYENIDLSERFVFCHTKLIDGHADTDGSWLRYAIKVLADHGSCREQTWEYVENRKALRQKPSKAAFAEARKCKPRSRAISIAPKNVSAIRGEIAKGRPVAISLPLFRSSYNSLRFHSEGRLLMKLGIFDSVAGYHAMCAVAFFDNPFLVSKGLEEEIGGGAFLVRNSWGTTWAKNNPLARMDSAGPGYAIVPYGYVAEYCFEAFTVAARSAAARSDHRELVTVASAVGKSWWRRTRDGVVAGARERLGVGAGLAMSSVQSTNPASGSCEAMHYSKIHVQYRDGSKPKGVRVVLGFSGGMTKPAYTDANGVAIVAHASTGHADVYVSGQKRGSLNAPGETAVFIS